MSSTRTRLKSSRVSSRARDTHIVFRVESKLEFLKLDRVELEFELTQNEPSRVQAGQYSTRLGSIAALHVVANTILRKRDEHLITFKNGPNMSQIDFFLVKMVHRLTCKDFKLYKEREFNFST